MKTFALQTPEWFQKTSVYQINPRTFSAEGTINSVTEELPFIAKMGFGTVYLCPVFEEDISEDKTYWSVRQTGSKTENPKNPYRIRNYFKIDPEYGTMDDLKRFTDTAHKWNMRVLLDLVYLHSGPLSPLFKEHPAFAKTDENGTPVLNRWNFYELNFECEGLREYLWANMVYYISVIGVDGFRCDVGDKVPLDFWREGLRRIRCVNPEAVMIDEGENPEYLSVFHAIYAFWWHDAIQKILAGESDTKALKTLREKKTKDALKGTLFLNDFENHDTVTDWEGARSEARIGHNGMELILALNYTVDGIPMVYCGNELCDTARVSMFANRFYPGDYETTDRSEQSKSRPCSLRRQEVIKQLNALKKNSRILMNGETKWLDTEKNSSIIGFERVSENGKILFIGNFCGKQDGFPLKESFTKILLQSEETPVFLKNTVKLPPYGYCILES